MPRSKYETHVEPYLEDIERWLHDGATEKEVSAKLGIHHTTFSKYVSLAISGDERYSKLAKPFTRGKTYADDQVEAALYHRALGYDYEERFYKQVKNKETGEWEEVLYRREERHMPADPTSAMFWLTNRKPDDWKYKREDKIAIEVDSGVVMMPSVLEEEANE